VGGSISSDAGNNLQRVGRCDEARCEVGVGLLSDVLLNAFPEKAIARERGNSIASIQREEEQLTSVAQHHATGTFFITSIRFSSAARSKPCST
jgi:predicted Zn-dependent peptidase